MANALVLFANTPGPLPIKHEFEAPSDAPVNLFVSGSARTGSAPTLLAVDIELDGKVIGSIVEWFNENESHRALVPVVIPVQFGFGPHSIRLVPQSGATITDSNDHFNAVIML